MQTEQVLFSLPLDRLEPIFKKWINDVLTDHQSTTPPATPTDNIRLYGDRAAATYLNCTPLTIQNLRKRGAIPFYRYGRKVFFIASELDTALKVENRRYGRKSNSVGSCHCASKS